MERWPHEAHRTKKSWRSIGISVTVRQLGQVKRTNLMATRLCRASCVCCRKLKRFNIGAMAYSAQSLPDSSLVLFETVSAAERFGQYQRMG